MQETTAGKHVYEAINFVSSDLAKIGIAKTRQNKQQGFAFRGIDEIYGALAPLLAEHRLLILPRVQERDISVRESHSGAALYSVALRVAFDFVSAVDGSSHTVQTFGESMDSGDKATNKAMSAAYKYACIQSFCIPLQGEDDDADANTPEPTKVINMKDRVQQQPGEPAGQLPADVALFQQLIAKAAPLGLAAYRKAWEAGTPQQRKLSMGIHEDLKVLAAMHDNKRADGSEIEKKAG